MSVDVPRGYEWLGIDDAHEHREQKEKQEKPKSEAEQERERSDTNKIATGVLNDFLGDFEENTPDFTKFNSAATTAMNSFTQKLEEIDKNGYNPPLSEKQKKAEKEQAYQDFVSALKTEHGKILGPYAKAQNLDLFALWYDKMKRRETLQKALEAQRNTEIAEKTKELKTQLAAMEAREPKPLPPDAQIEQIHPPGILPGKEKNA